MNVKGTLTGRWYADKPNVVADPVADFSYVTKGLFTTMYPNNSQAEVIWNEIAEVFGENARFPSVMQESIFRQVREAGYTIVKSTNKQTIEQLLSEFAEAFGLD